MTIDSTEERDDQDLQPIPEDVQNIPTEEIVSKDYEILPPSEVQDTNVNKEQNMRKHHPTHDLLDRSPSESDSSEMPHGHAFSAGYESPMATRIGGEQKDTDEATERLRQLHEGRHQSDGYHSVRESHRDKKRIAQAICSALPLAAHEREKVVSVVQNLNLDRFGNQKGIPRVTLGVVAVVVDEQHRAEKGPDAEIVARTDEFRALCKTHEVAMSDLSTIKKKVRENYSVWMEDDSRNRDPALPRPTALGDIPREYWEQKELKEWVFIARRWDEHSEEFCDAIPDEYREKVEKLQEHRPWEDGEKEQDVDDAEMTEATGEDDTLESVGAIEELEAEVEAEAEALLDEMQTEHDE